MVGEGYGIGAQQGPFSGLPEAGGIGPLSPSAFSLPLPEPQSRSMEAPVLNPGIIKDGSAPADRLISVTAPRIPNEGVFLNQDINIL